MDVIEVVLRDAASILHRLPTSAEVDPLAVDHVLDLELRLVRERVCRDLVDGRSWRFTGFTEGATVIGLQTALAITCDEVFVRAALGNTDTQVYRIRLDSLGLGEPAD